ncbi:fasciclin domain-containing protein [Terriglobus aquaticus]|uniref:Fasciclin domain-containing protein n=1 Tax=Terriglobus aquaticus TaxID=940139 RepID=A0ABW9KLC3_9BACT|nr:fasciclin domain-containing protein [Terriglobus aquaticus]
MKKITRALLALALAAGLFGANHAVAQKDPDVGGAPMYPNKTIVENAAASPIHKTLVTAVKAAGLVDTLSSAGPFTVFAPTDDAFNKLPAGTVDTLTQPENKAQLTKILTYHVVKGKISSKDLAKMIKKGNGTATLTTVEGGTLKAMMNGSNITLTDEKGGTATVTTADVFQSNGVIHVIDTVLMPN